MQISEIPTNTNFRDLNQARGGRYKFTKCTYQFFPSKRIEIEHIQLTPQSFSNARFFEPISDLASAKHFRWVVLAGSLTWCPNTFWTRLPEPLPSASPHDHMHLYKTCPIGSPQHFSHWVYAKQLRSDSPEKTLNGGPQSICDRPSWGYVALARSEACPMASPQRIFIHSS